MNSEVVFTTSALMDFLSQVDELQGYDIAVYEAPDGNVQVVIGDSAYEVDCSQAEEVSVDDKAVEQVEDINDSAYMDIVESDDSEEIVEGGLIAEVAKTLAIGGLARLAGKAVKDVLK